MGRLRWIRGALAVGFVAACAVGPNYKPPAVTPPEAWRPPSVVYDSVQPFYDSVNATLDSSVRARILTQPGATAADSAAPRAVADSLANVNWFELLQDTTLQRLIDIALRENQDIQIAVQTITEFRAQYGVAKSDLFPQVYANGLFGTNQVFFPSVGTTQYDVFKATADLAWELDFWGKIRRNTQAARADYLAREENERAVILSLVSDVATAYLELRELDQDLEISLRTLQSRKETLRLSQHRFEQGLISELDVKQFEAEVAAPAAQVAEFARRIAQKENQLSVLLGRNPANVPRGRSLTQVLAPVDVPAGIPSSLLTRRPDVRQADQQYAAANARIGVAIGQRLPTIVLTGQYGTQSAALDQMFSSGTDIYQAFGGISIPLFTGGRLKSQEDAARARAEQAQYQYQKVVLQAFREVNDALASVRTARDQEIATAQQVAALRRAEHLATLRYENGIASYLDVLDAQRQLFSAELSLTSAQRLRSTGVIQLYKALGGGWPVSAADSVSVPATKLPGE